jgi:diaminohydroxyphosphoribosylaminopyrimidine deaminase/5-amino-6-(5-phosphoribosylamino)uracil reductase
LSNRDFNLMQRAFAEAAKSDWLFTAPNPLVGAIALCGGHVVAYGHHQQFGQAHAEEMALQDCPQADELYVTLEPCSSTGGAKKRAACVELIGKSNVKRVVIGATDPDPRHAGRAVELLRQQGIEVELLNCDQQFAAQNPAFLSHLTRKVPFTIVKWASTADGFVASSSGKSKWISNPESRAEVHQLRSVSQAIAVAKGTIVADNPSLTARDVEHNILNTKVLIGCANAVDNDFKILQDDMQRLWFDSDECSPSWSTDLDYFHQQADLVEIWKQLSKEYHLGRVLVEGGPRFIHSLIHLGLVHAIVKYEAPLLLCGGMPAIAADGFDSPRQAMRLEHELRCDHDGDLRRAWLIA